ncbi:MAG: DUF4832 domain-containing protein, partial [Clostridia bacterium]|nr:DUF4832 domain-containing protein [Clostridia bacterium]
MAMILLMSGVGCADNGGATASSQAATSSSGIVLPDTTSEEETVIATLIADTAALSADGTVTFDLTAMADAKTPLANPDKGWYLHYYDNGTSNYGNRKAAGWTLDYMRYLDHIYIRLPWNTIEPSEGAFQWAIIDSVVNDFAQYGVGVSFRITCKEGGSYCPYATPKWVRDAGAEGKDLDDGSWEPNYGDEIFLAKLENFHKAFAARYASNPNVRYVDVGSFGDYGEGHTASGSKRSFPWSTVEKLFNIYAKYYPANIVCVSDDFIGSGNVSGLGAQGQKMRDYVAEHGWTWRDDSICVNYFMERYGDTDSVRSQFLFDETWEKEPIVMELEHYKVVIDTTYHEDNWKGGSVFKAACRRTHATYAGWHGFINEFMVGDNVAFANEMANLLGYWYFHDKMDVARNGSQLTCKFNWRNEGFAKAYNVYDLDLILTDGKGEDHVFNLKGFDNTKIMPKDSENENAAAPTLVTSHTVDLGDLAGRFHLRQLLH